MGGTYRDIAEYVSIVPLGPSSEPRVKIGATFAVGDCKKSDALLGARYAFPRTAQKEGVVFGPQRVRLENSVGPVWVVERDVVGLCEPDSRACQPRREPL
jgi:hypothetical protein